MTDSWDQESVKNSELTWESEYRREEKELADGELNKDMDDHWTQKVNNKNINYKEK